MRKELNLGTLGGGAGAAGRSLGEGCMLSLSCVCYNSVLGSGNLLAFPAQRVALQVNTRLSRKLLRFFITSVGCDK